ncbi:MAG TPA: ROK family protein [Nitrososphaeraceae archaeon]|nr:ROK family protein [Nitrososphaeraceae archaeon]
MFAALDLGKTNIQIVLKNKDGKILKENKIQRNTKTILEFIENIITRIIIILIL